MLYTQSAYESAQIQIEFHTDKEIVLHYNQHCTTNRTWILFDWKWFHWCTRTWHLDDLRDHHDKRGRLGNRFLHLRTFREQLEQCHNQNWSLVLHDKLDNRDQECQEFYSNLVLSFDGEGDVAQFAADRWAVHKLIRDCKVGHMTGKKNIIIFNNKCNAIIAVQLNTMIALLVYIQLEKWPFKIFCCSRTYTFPFN